MNRTTWLPAALALGLAWFSSPAGIAADSPQAAETAVRQALMQQYRALDQANTSRDSKTLFAALGAVYAPNFVATDAQGKTIPQDKWRVKVQDDATLGGRIRPNTGNFRVVSQQESYETMIDKLTLAGRTAIAEVQRRRLVGTVGRTAPGKPRQRTGEVWTEYDRDRWTRTPRGWRLQATQTLKMTAISNIGFVDPPGTKAE